MRGTLKKAIKADLKQGMLTGREIAEKHNVSTSYVSRIKVKNPTTKKLSPGKKTPFEEHNAEKTKAMIAKDKYDDTQALQKRLGYRYVTRVGKYGITETVWTNK